MGHSIGRIKATIIALFAAVAALMAPAAMAQEEAPATEEVAEAVEAAPESAYTPMAPTEGKGMPTAYEDG
ncbi:MAG: hypothetical protein AAFY19_04705, partial [Pseudomonadota bacterium]